MLKDFLKYICKSCGMPIGLGIIAYIVYTGIPYKLVYKAVDWLFSVID